MVTLETKLKTKKCNTNDHESNGSGTATSNYPLRQGVKFDHGRERHLIRPESRITGTLLTGFILPVLLLAFAPAARGEKLCNTDQSLPLMPQNGSLISGHASLFRGNRELDILIGAEHLMPGVAYTTWFIYFDDTSQCLTPHQCGGPDLTMPASNPEGVFGRMDSAVAGPDRRLVFKASLRNFRISLGSAVHVVLFSHGPAETTDNRERARQLLTPEAPGLGAPGLGVQQRGSLVAGVAFDITSCK
jgi:hypothetical protein